MLQYDMTAQMRKTFGKGAARTLRREGQTPAILYGPHVDPLTIKLETKPFTKILHAIKRGNAVINLAIEGGKKKESHNVMLKEVQVDPIHDTLIHADFFRITFDAPMTLNVPVKYTGKAKGVELGGDLQVNLQELSLSGLVLDIPDYVEIDVTELNIGDRITCKDISVPGNVTLQQDLDTLCVSVVVGSQPEMEEEEEEVAAAEEAPAETPSEAPTEE